MPSPPAGQLNVAAALQALQRQVDQLARRPMPAGEGGAVLGYAEVSYEFPSDIVANDATGGIYAEATAVTINWSLGDPALDASGDTITYSVGDAVGIYMVTAHLKLAPHVDAVPTNMYAEDGAFTFTLLDPIIDTVDMTMLGRRAFLPETRVTTTRYLNYEYPMTPLCRWRNSIDTTGVLDVQTCDLFITRLAPP